MAVLTLEAADAALNAGVATISWCTNELKGVTVVLPLGAVNTKALPTVVPAKSESVAVAGTSATTGNAATSAAVTPVMV